jgi:biopolymer transport protein ExbD
MKLVASACLAALLATAGCSNQRATRELLIEIVNPAHPQIMVMAEEHEYPQLVEALTDLRQKGEANSPKMNVILRAEDDIPYAKIALVMLACANSQVETLRFNDFSIPLPVISDPSRKPPSRRGLTHWIEIELRNTGEDAEKVEIILVGTTEELGADFEALRKALLKLRNEGTSADMPIHIAPTMDCREKFVVQGLRTVKEAGFKDVHLAIPYE